MTDFMITDKGIFDSSMCPILWLDEVNDKNRVKPYRSYEPMESVYQALSDGQANEYVHIEEISEDKRVALPVKESFWLHVPFNYGKLLLTAHRIEWRGIGQPSGEVDIYRVKRYDPRDQDNYDAEVPLQVLMVRHLMKFFPQKTRVSVVTLYPQWDKQVMKCPNLHQLLFAETFVKTVLDQKEGRVPLVPQHHKCHYCWWKNCKSKIDTRTQDLKKPKLTEVSNDDP